MMSMNFCPFAFTCMDLIMCSIFPALGLSQPILLFIFQAALCKCSNGLGKYILTCYNILSLLYIQQSLIFFIKKTKTNLMASGLGQVPNLPLHPSLGTYSLYLSTHSRERYTPSIDWCLDRSHCGGLVVAYVPSRNCSSSSSLAIHFPIHFPQLPIASSHLYPISYCSTSITSSLFNTPSQSPLRSATSNNRTLFLLFLFLLPLHRGWLSLQGLYSGSRRFCPRHIQSAFTSVSLLW